MRSYAIVSLALATTLAMAVAAATVLGNGGRVDVRPSYATVEVTMQQTGATTAAKGAAGRGCGGGGQLGN